MIPKGNRGNAISIVKNDQIVDTTPDQNDFVSTHITCFDSYDLENDIFEIRHSGGNNGVTIYVNIVHEGITSQLFFGSKMDLSWVTIDGDDLKCLENIESTNSIRIKNRNIIDSQCIGL